MPGFDGSGPAGKGSMTGRGMGYCGTGQGRCFGRGFGRGRMRGRGFGPGPFAGGSAGPGTREDEAEYMRRKKEALEEELAETSRYLSELESEKE